MEETWRRILNITSERIEELASSAKNINTTLNPEAAQDDLLNAEIIASKLESGLLKLKNELNNYFRFVNEPSADEISDIATRQLEAEEILSELLVKIKQKKTTEVRNDSVVTGKLPRLNLPEFNGNILEWHIFWDQFQSQVDSRNLCDVDKFLYLSSALKGEAKDLIDGLGATNKNYGIAVATLRERYGRTEHIKDAHYSALNKITPAGNSVVDCRKVLNDIERHLRVLSSLGENTSHSFFRFLIYEKFPEDLIYELKKRMKEDSINEIRRELSKLITAREDAFQSTQKWNNKSENHTIGTLQAVEHIIQNNGKRPNPFTERRNVNTRKSGHFRKRTYNNMSNNKPRQNVWKRPRKECDFCRGGHYSDQCQKYSTLQERKQKLGRSCFLCFRNGHNVLDCRSKLKCRYCTRKHNRAICPKQFKNPTNSTDQTPLAVTTGTQYFNLENVTNDTKTCLNKEHIVSCLQTATARVWNDTNSNSPQITRLLLDCGSQRSYITTRLAQLLNLPNNTEDLLMVYTFGSDKPKEMLSPSAEINIVTKRGIQRKIMVNIVPHITNKIPITNFPNCTLVDIWADDNSVGDGIDLLIGNDYYFSFIRGKHQQIGENLFLIDTDWGWILSGHLNSDINENALSIITYCQCHGPSCPYFTEPDLPLRDVDMKFLWTLESIGITDSPKTTREEEAVKFFNETVKYDNGRYEVKWPWIQCPPDIPTNYSLAYGRLKSLLRRSDYEILQEYDQILCEQLEANIIEVFEPQTIPIYQVDPPIHYLPHHMVKQEGKRGRIVYDASAKIKDHKSLNECMYRGPSMLEDLTALLLKFRCGKIGITADIEKAFLQVGLQNQDRDVTRFLWVKDLSKEPTEDNLLHYRFCRVPFGIISSPFLLTATIRHHLAKGNETLFKSIADRCYVDNLVTCAEDYKEAIAMFAETRNVFKELGMNIREWMSNDERFIETIPDPLRSQHKDKIKVLGLIWNVKKDNLELKLNETFSETDSQESKFTKRNILRTIARVYDPFGFASPLILPAKIFFQQLCVLKIKWDTTLSTELIHTWISILSKLERIKEIEIPRYVGNDTHTEKTQKYELHTFTDASMKAYAAVTYLRVIRGTENKIAFLMSKARITPVEDQQNLKIPRLELLAYLIGSRLMKYIKVNLNLPIEKQYLWTDSLIVLDWIKSNKLLPPFITRRVNEIKEIKDVEFRYVNTNVNPADLATRPELWEIKRELWFNGPQFLRQEPKYWPSSTKSVEQQTFLAVGEDLDITDDPDILMEQIQLDTDLDFRTTKEQGHIDHEVTKISEVKHLDEIIELQKEHFPAEVSGKETDLTRNLGLYLDIDGILRSRGRLSNTRWSYDMKHPILLPQKSKFTDKIIQETHEENYHVGTPHTLNIIREKYWILRGRAQVQRVLKKCAQCIKQGGGPYRLPPAPILPTERVNYSEPYTYTGQDYFGPVFVTTKLGNEKRWVCLYTCLAVRAVHMEIVKDLTAEECLLAFRRFIAARGRPQMVLSDNALQFKLTSEVLSSPYCVNNSIKWKFIPQLAPWHGGVYERLVALAKHCMKRTLEKHLLNDSQLHTVIKEIESVINTRPLTYVGADLDRVLRPKDFLSLGDCLVPEPTESDIIGKNTATKVDLIASWKRGIMIRDEFKDMFIRQYLPSLRERYNHSTKQPRSTSNKVPQVGDVVQIHDDSKKRINWKVGKIITLIKGQDGHCRVAKVKVGNVEFTRSIGHLYPLESEVDNNIPQTVQTKASNPTTQRELIQTQGGLEKSDSLSDRTPIVEEDQNLTQGIMEVPVCPDTVDGNGNCRTEAIEEVLDKELPSKESSLQEEITHQRSPSQADPELPFQISQTDDDEENVQTSPAAHTRPERIAALRAREKIAEWTRHLVALL